MLSKRRLRLRASAIGFQDLAVAEYGRGKGAANRSADSELHP